MPIESEILQAQTPAELARIFHCNPTELRRLNPFLPADDVPTNKTTAISVPDPSMVPLIAAWLSAELLIAPPSPICLRAAQALVVPALSDPTAADIVLARLLIAAAPQKLTDGWRALVRDAASELDERRRMMEMADRAYEFLSVPP
jgi:hypothetical protein